MDPLVPNIEIGDDEYVCAHCNLVHWRATPAYLACEALANLREALTA